MNKFYDGTKLLSLNDIQGNKPEIYICSSNRSAGKTTYFNRLLLNRYKKGNGKFMLIYRNKYEVPNASEKFFKEINKLFFKDDIMTEQKRAEGDYYELFLNEISCGYAVSLKASTKLKNFSHFFADTGVMLFDEFQDEDNRYLSDEVQKLLSLHTTVARGGGEQVRYVPLIMISNPVSIINPYYAALGISERLQADTNFLKGEGWVMEQGFNETASQAQMDSAFNKAFKDSEYLAYSSQGIYLNDKNTFIEEPKGKNTYFLTFKFEGKDYAIREYQNNGWLYASDNVDYSYPVKITISSEDMEPNYVMIKNNDFILKTLKWYFNKGAFRFKNLQSKRAVMHTLSYL